MAALRLIVGLGNPGPRYEGTPHNVGAEFVAALASRFRIALADEPKFKGRLGRGTMLGHDMRLLIPNTFMNLSGESVGAVATFFKFAPAEILVAHDEMAFEPGVLRLEARRRPQRPQRPSRHHCVVGKRRRICAIADRRGAPRPQG